MFRLSYCLLARPALRKGAVKVAKAAKVLPVKGLAQPAASVLKAPVAPPLEMVPPKMPSLDIVPPSHAAVKPVGSGKGKVKVRAASPKTPAKKPAKGTAKVAGGAPHKPAKAKPVASRLGAKKPMKLRLASKPKAKAKAKANTKGTSKVSKAAKPKAPQHATEKPRRK
ncbi:uncharacterized protein Tco025E_06354 [Trypanosoma conorhini]|uniref:Uncharacterized protein n=1 Tax=Trypanosoma conorhini TaxID=83891 RepID=A0A3R7MD50_9TRYP|nr:uncharacterized protein Tco025E_06354 [Trypanosoma conorhini]RNF13091.1 hypothetical protein Tco025E_06354 [Trypanosoma conorhini]